MLRYLEYQTACDATFVAFMISWLVTRHYLFIKVIISAIFDEPLLIPFAWIPERGYYQTRETWIAFVTMLCALEVCGSVHSHLTLRVLKICLS